jgi:hypothetical protein
LVELPIFLLEEKTHTYTLNRVLIFSTMPSSKSPFYNSQNHSSNSYIHPQNSNQTKESKLPVPISPVDDYDHSVSGHNSSLLSTVSEDSQLTSPLLLSQKFEAKLKSSDLDFEKLLLELSPNVSNTTQPFTPSQRDNEIAWHRYHALLVQATNEDSAEITIETPQEMVLRMLQPNVSPPPHGALYIIASELKTLVDLTAWNIRVVPSVPSVDGIIDLNQAKLILHASQIADIQEGSPLLNTRALMLFIDASSNLIATKDEYRGYRIANDTMYFPEALQPLTPYPSWAIAGAGVGVALTSALLLMRTAEGKQSQAFTLEFFASRCLPDQPVDARLVAEALILTVQRVPASAVFRSATGRKRASSRLLCKTVRRLLHPEGGSLGGVVVISVILAAFVSISTLQSGSERARLVGAAMLSAFILLMAQQWHRKSTRQQERHWNRVMSDTHSFLANGVAATRDAQDAFVDYFQDPLLPETTVALRRLLGVTQWQAAWRSGQQILGKTSAEQRVLAMRTFKIWSGKKGLPLSAVVDVSGDPLEGQSLTTSVIATILAMDVVQRRLTRSETKAWRDVNRSILDHTSSN